MIEKDEVRLRRSLGCPPTPPGSSPPELGSVPKKSNAMIPSGRSQLRVVAHRPSRRPKPASSVLLRGGSGTSRADTLTESAAALSGTHTFVGTCISPRSESAVKRRATTALATAAAITLLATTPAQASYHTSRPKTWNCGFDDRCTKGHEERSEGPEDPLLVREGIREHRHPGRQQQVRHEPHQGRRNTQAEVQPPHEPAGHRRK